MAGYVFWIRHEPIDNPELGPIPYHYCWGHRERISADTNRDGSIDFLARIDRQSFPEEYWEDGNFDGVFDRHPLMKAGCMDQLEIDSDEDGDYETRLHGAEALRFYKETAPKLPIEAACPATY